MSVRAVRGGTDASDELACLPYWSRYSDAGLRPIHSQQCDGSSPRSQRHRLSIFDPDALVSIRKIRPVLCFDPHWSSLYIATMVGSFSNVWRARWGWHLTGYDKSLVLFTQTIRKFWRVTQISRHSHNLFAIRFSSPIKHKVLFGDTTHFCLFIDFFVRHKLFVMPTGIMSFLLWIRVILYVQLAKPIRIIRYKNPFILYCMFRWYACSLEERKNM